MDVTHSMISVNTGGMRENNRRDLINLCKTLETDFSILQETNKNFSYQHNVRELWDGEVIISLGKKQTCGVLALAKTVSLLYKNTTDTVLVLYAPSGGVAYYCKNRLPKK